MNYTIEGTIAEIKKENEKYSFLIFGTEGYSIKQKQGKDYIKLNVLCLNDSSVTDNKEPRNAILLEPNEYFSANSDDVVLLSAALVNGKRCRISFVKQKGGDKNFNDKKLKTSSITLLSE